jgi:predicted DNA-binding protein
MPHVSLRVSAEEKTWMESYAKVHGVSLSDAIKDAFFEMLEDEYDLKVIREYEAEKEKGDMQYFTLAEVKKELGLDE